jgi:hypothetical protein
MAAEVGDAGERLLVGAIAALARLGIGCTASPPGCSNHPASSHAILSGDRRLGLALLALLDHPSDHPDDPTGSAWSRPDRQGIQANSLDRPGADQIDKASKLTA